MGPIPIPGASMIPTLALALGLGVPFMSRLCFRDYATPLGVYCFVWGFCVASLFLDLVDYPALGPELWWAVALSGFCFLAGATAALLPALPLPPGRPRFQSFAVHRGRLERALLVMPLLGGIGLALLIKRHHNNRGSILKDLSGLVKELFFSCFQTN